MYMIRMREHTASIITNNLCQFDDGESDFSGPSELALPRHSLRNQHAVTPTPATEQSRQGHRMWRLRVLRKYKNFEDVKMEDVSAELDVRLEKLKQMCAFASTDS